MYLYRNCRALGRSCRFPSPRSSVTLMSSMRSISDSATHVDGDPVPSTEQLLVVSRLSLFESKYSNSSLSIGPKERPLPREVQVQFVATAAPR